MQGEPQLKEEIRCPKSRQNEAVESEKGKVPPISKVPHSCKPKQQIITQPIEKKKKNEAFVVVKVIFYTKKRTSTKPPTVIAHPIEATANLRYKRKFPLQTDASSIT